MIIVDMTKSQADAFADYLDQMNEAMLNNEGDMMRFVATALRDAREANE